MPAPEPLRIFISYAHRDGTELAQRFQADLAQQGFNVWLDKPRLCGGAIWSMEIECAIDAGQVMIALLSPAPTRLKSAARNSFALSIRASASFLCWP